jgi:C1A family cysteine protease
MTKTPNGKGLGRIAKPDARDHKYLLPKRSVADAPIYKYWMATSPVLDQGPTSQCVIYATDKFLTAYPVKNKGFLTAQERERVYKEVQKLDEWDGEDYDGTSVRGSMKYLQSVGLVSEYRWAFDLETALAHLLTTGPLIMGTDWYEEMFATDAKGYVKVVGEVMGGHSYVAIGANRSKKNPDGTQGAVQCINSWGPKWGANGRFWLSFRDFDKLIKAQGEAATPTELRGL